MDTVPVSAAACSPATAPSPQNQGAIKRLLGQFARLEFWEEVLSLLVRESIAALISAVGGTLVTIAAERRSAASSRIKGVIDQATSTTAARGPGAAFSQAYSPQPSYRPTYPAGVPNQAPPPYPGF
jgi:hypothetical protein